MYKKFSKLFLLTGLTLLLVSCAVKVPVFEEINTRKLAQLLQSLDSDISYDDARYLSQDIFMQTAVLTQKFKMTSPPQYHNFLVNVGLKDKGLCYHWADTLYAYFSKQNHPSFEFHLISSHRGEYWREHNALVVSAKSKKIEEGIVIDPWRHSGILYFSKLKDDIEYHWVHRPSRGCRR
jgi:hypothetical protein